MVKRARSDLEVDPDSVPVGTKVVVTKKGRHYHHQTAVIKGKTEQGKYNLELLDGEGTSAALKRGDFVTMVPDGANGCIINGLSLADRRAFHAFVMSFGISDSSWKKANTVLPDKNYNDVCSYATLYLQHLGNPVGEGPLYAEAGMDLGVPQKPDDIQLVLERIAILHLLHRKALQFEGELSTAQKDWFSSIKPNCSKKYQMKSHGLIQMPMGWPPELDRRLVQAVVTKGYGNWGEVAECEECDILPMICPEASHYSQLNSEEKYLLGCIIEARTADIAMSVAKEYRTRHNAGENLSAFNLEPRHVQQRMKAVEDSQLGEPIQETKFRQMIDEWSYHEPMVGPNHQAEIPNLLKRCRENRYSLQRQAILQENYTDKQEGRLVWDCHRHDPDVLKQYLDYVADWAERNMPSNPNQNWIFSEESSLDFLHANGGDYDQAMNSLKLGWPALCRNQVVWEPAEIDVFAAAYNHYGKDFRAIADSLPCKSWKDVAHFYFKHKSNDGNHLNLPKAVHPNELNQSCPDQLTSAERAIAGLADVAPSNLIGLKQKLVDLSASQGKVSRETAVELANSQDSIWAKIDEVAVNKIYDLLVQQQMIRSN